MKVNQNEIIEENENKIINEEENKSDDNITLVKVNSSKLLIKKKGSKDDSFEIISKNKEFEDDFGFSETSFKTVYENDPLLSHVITHTNKYIEKNKNNSEDIAHLSDFISFDEISKEIINTILIKGIPESLPCLRPLIWKALIGFYPLNNLEQWKEETINNNKIYENIIKKYYYYPNKLEEEIAIIFYIFSKDDNPFYIKSYIESDSYFTFGKLMDQIKDIFQMENIDYSQLYVKEIIDEIKKILKKIDYELMNCFEENGIEIDNFVLRWILVLFAQEFTIDIAVNFWDRLFTQKNKIKFICYISAAIIKKNKDTIMKLDAGGIMEWAQELQNKMNEIDISDIVQLALQIQKKYKRNESNNISLK